MTSSDRADKNFRPIKSYVVRGGRLTPAQQQAMEEMWPEFGLDIEQGSLEWSKVFGRQAPLVLEIGFGMGDSLIKMAQQNAHQNFIGIDVHPPGVGTLLRDIKQAGLSNIRVYQNDATLLLKECIQDNVLDRVHIFFPDPWHKKRHNKRRLIQPAFVEGLRHKLKSGGKFHLSTDWEHYAEQIMAVLTTAEGFVNCYGKGEFATEHQRPSTKFERRGERLGHGVWDLIFEKL
jgi:tRNA (guanine-N7-)-methyltransferase